MGEKTRRLLERAFNTVLVGCSHFEIGSGQAVYAVHMRESTLAFLYCDKFVMSEYTLDI
ncbi:MAG: hypothetical protein DHS20C01_33970 [marine bacterium B5-7]|nr:MAG: hypothetical protein DHS20C01_33970 [marine bacterium B5-7]